MASPDDEAVALLQHAAREVLGRDLPGLTAASHLVEIGVDSVGLLEMVGAVEDKVGLRFPDDEIARLATVADVTALIERARRASEAR
jgi:acyl carrier protein